MSSYVIGIVVWAGLGIALGALVAVTGMCLCLFRCILPICCNIDVCGKRYPTPKVGPCMLGFRPKGTKLTEGFGYGWGTLLTRACTIVALVLSIITILVGYNKGVLRFVPALKAIPASTQTAMSVMQQLEPPIGRHLRNTAVYTLTKAGDTILDIANRYTNYEKVRGLVSVSPVCHPNGGVKGNSLHWQTLCRCFAHVTAGEQYPLSVIQLRNRLPELRLHPSDFCQHQRLVAPAVWVRRRRDFHTLRCGPISGLLV